MRTMIAIPCMDMVHTEFMRSVVGMQHLGEVQITFSQASLVYDGRNKLASIAIEGGFDRILWLDSDMNFEPDLELKLHADLDEGREMVSALYFSRRAPISPVVYRDIASDPLPGGMFSPRADSFLDYPAESVFPVAGCGFGAVMMTTELLRRLQAAYGLPFTPLPGFGEDLSFCLRVQELGAEMWCDSSIKLGHAGMAIYTEAEYRPEP